MPLRCRAVSHEKQMRRSEGESIDWCISVYESLESLRYVICLDGSGGLILRLPDAL
jgi:hypothetical protein